MSRCTAGGSPRRITLSWPSADLSSNARIHWSKRARAVASYRTEARTLAKVARASGSIIEFAYHPPDNRRRDAHNMPHMLKSAIDGIADAMGRDDSEFRCIFPSQFAEAVKGGAVVVTITPSIVEIPFRGEING